MNKTQFSPILDRVIVKQTSLNTASYGALILPDLGHERTIIGEVVAIGPGLLSPFTATRSEMQSKVGSIVLFPLNNAIEINHDNEQFYIIKESEILTILNTNEQ